MKSLEDFYRRHKGVDAVQSQCKVCQNSDRWKNGRIRDEEDRIRVNINNRKSYHKNKHKYARQQFEKRLNWKIIVLSILGGKCVDCGEDNPLLLEFDHKDPIDKLFEVTKAVTSPNKYPWNILIAEVNKCELRCRNCHMLSHVGFEIKRQDTGWVVLGQKGS